MEQIFAEIQIIASTHPWILFGLLLLAGFNIPVSEDGMLFIAGVLAAKNPERMWEFFLAVFLGAYLSDLICYGLGRFLGPKLFSIKFFASMITEKRLQSTSLFYERYGVWTLILGRFIPFGVRNGLFLTAGLSRMNFLKFALSDLLAATISCSFFFTIYFKYGEAVIELVKKGNLVIFGLAIVVGAAFLWKRKRRSTTNNA